MIGWHIVYKVKTEEDGTERLRTRICPHGNQDRGKDNVRKDCSTAQCDVIRLMLALVTFIDYRLGLVDIKGAYLQSEPIQRRICVRPPYGWHDMPRGHLSYMHILRYGISEAGRQWALSMETWILDHMGMERA